MMRASIAAVILLAACRPAFDLADRDDIFAEPGDHGVMCAASFEWPHVDGDVIGRALDRAHDERSIVELFAHDPGVTVPADKIEKLLDDARAHDLRWLTYRELAAGVPRDAGIALSFDDYYVEDWATLRDTQAHGLDAYLADDIDPALAAMRADGWAPIVFAYPMGHRTAEIDRALLDREGFALLRSVMRECPRDLHGAARADRGALPGDEPTEAE
jgi:hypothetical protein